MNNYQPIIGLEIHVELKTNAKMFCQCPANYFGKPPNTQTCPVCLGLPGALPVPNRKAIEWTQLIGKALNCQISKISKFDRKHYFYPDLPKGYQISQYDQPIASNGLFKLKIIEEKQYRIKRVHIEEDTGKLIHHGNETFIDFNRSGVPLVEIVTEPDFNNSDEVKRFLEELQAFIRYIDVSGCDMEKGTMRMEPNISLQEIRNQKFEIRNKSKILNSKDKNDTLPNYKVEVKNINSFRFVKQAIEYEIKRQSRILEAGKIPNQETRGFNEKKNSTFSQRTKEEAHDYRYFPEPDIPPIEFSEDDLKMIKQNLPVLPNEKIEKYIKEYGLRYDTAYTITRHKLVILYFEEVTAYLKNKKLENLIKDIANIIVNKKISIKLPIPEFVEKSLVLCAPKKIDEKQLMQIIDATIKKNNKAVEDYRNGKENALMFLVGQAVRIGRLIIKERKVDPQTVRKKLIEKIKIHT